MTLPHHQRNGYGLFLIDLSYLLTRREGRTGSPEKPLSELGLFSYVSYWRHVVLGYLAAHRGPISIEQLARDTALTVNDVLATMEYLGLLRWDVRTRAFQIHAVSCDEPPLKLRPRPELLRWQPCAWPR